MAVLLELARPFTLLAPAVGAGCGAWVAVSATGRSPDPRVLACGVLSAMFATGASNAWNQVYDVALDRVNKPHRPIPSGRMSAAAALLVGHAFAALSLAFAALSTPGFLLCVAVGIVGTWIYSAPPLRTKRSPLGALLTIAIPRGFLVPVAGWLLVAPLDRPDPWALGVVSGLFILGAAATKDFGDVRGDLEHGCRTLPGVLGPRAAARVIAPFLVLPFLLYPAFGALGWLAASSSGLWALCAVLGLFGLVVARLLLRDPEGLAIRGGNHAAWAGMYLLALGLHVGSALVYFLS
jgi:4-hydroxybenzoate polyprenyltransferase